MVGNYQNVSISALRLYMTEDFGDTISFESEAGVYAFAFEYNVIYAVQYNNKTALSDLYLKADDKNAPLVKAQFRDDSEVPSIDYVLYLILDSDEGVSFLSVCNDLVANIGNLFQANINDGFYWLNRPNMRVTCDPSYYRGADFQRILSMEGTYISNGYSTEAFEKASPSSEIDDFIQSAVSFNKGGTWNRLTYNNSNDNSCDENCYLNLYSKSESRGVSAPIYATENAVGIILATGNVGEYRNQSPDAKNVYLSRNGGYSWEKIYEGAYEYGSSNHGSLFLMSKITNTTEILYSWNQGISWDSCIIDGLTEGSVNVLEIIDVSTPEQDSTFLIKGVTGYHNYDGFIAFVSFSNVDSIVSCQGSDNPDTDNSDYETFNPETDGSCLLGQKLSFVRRKRDATCRNDLPDELKTFSGSCACTRNDFTCDGDCWRESFDENNNLICSNDCVGLANDPEAPPSDCYYPETYLKPSGYRVVFGDICEGGEELQAPIETECPVASPSPTPTPKSTPSATTTPPKTGGNGTTNTPTGDSSGMSIFWIIFLILLVLFILSSIIIIVFVLLYKFHPRYVFFLKVYLLFIYFFFFFLSRFRSLINNYLPETLGGGNGETKLYSVLGDNDVNSLFEDDDDMFINENGIYYYFFYFIFFLLLLCIVKESVSSDKTKLTSLLDLDDDY